MCEKITMLKATETTCTCTCRYRDGNIISKMRHAKTTQVDPFLHLFIHGGTQQAYNVCPLSCLHTVILHQVSCTATPTFSLFYELCLLWLLTVVCTCIIM